MDTTNPAFSVLTSRAMDRLGYSYHMVQERKRFAVFSVEQVIGDAECRIIIAGSKGEGLTSWWESDMDFMFEFRDIVCTNDVSKYRNDANMTAFAVERENASPGYTCLRLVHLGESYIDLLEYVDDELYILNNFQRSLISMDVDLFSNFNTAGPSLNMDQAGIFINTPADFGFKFDHVSGPAVNIDSHFINFDAVLAMRFECPEIKQAFVSRQRKHNQPSQEVLDEVAKLDTHVVAVGNSRSDMSDLEWRICDTEAELYLMGELNETQLQLYVLLKLLAKSVLKEVDDISSYVLKTVVLWMTELIHRDKFQKETITQRLLDALKILRQCVKRCYLPNYMLPQRNMFSGKLKRQKKVLELLTYMIDAGETVVLLCPRLKEAMLDMFVSSERTQHLSDVRDKVEVVFTQLCSEDNNVDHETLVAFMMWCVNNCWQDVIAHLTNELDKATVFCRIFLKLRELFT